jgi:hypothetical protein
VLRLLVTANVPSSLILVTLMMEMLRSSETLVLTRATWRNILRDRILHSHRREKLKFYTVICHVLTTAKFLLKISVVWDIKPCSVLKVNRRFRGRWSSLLQNRIINEVR